MQKDGEIPPLSRGDAFQGYSRIAGGFCDSLEQLHITSRDHVLLEEMCGFAKELDSEGRQNPWAHDPNPTLYSAEALWADPHPNGKEGMCLLSFTGQCG